MGTDHYFIYITTNKNKTVLYIGVTNNLKRRIGEHKQSTENFNSKTFTGRYNACHLIYHEHFSDITQTIQREKQLKGWTRQKKIDLINSFNPEWRFMEDEV